MTDAAATGTERERLLALFPGGLGDFLCCWAALEALRTRDGLRLTLAARPAWLAVLPDNAAQPLSIDRREIADLFASTPLAAATAALFAGHQRSESWTGYGDPNFASRLAHASGAHATSVHPFRAMREGEHAAQYYARCLAGPPPVTHLDVRPAAAHWADDLWRSAGISTRVLAIHPGSGGARKIWRGAAAVADAWRDGGGRVIWVTGPAESGKLFLPPGRGKEHDLELRDEPLDRIAAVVQRADRYLGNDSGISHLAGLVGARGVVVFGPSDPRVWRPLGDALAVLTAPDACTRCGPDILCTHRMPAARVLSALA